MNNIHTFNVSKFAGFKDKQDIQLLLRDQLLLLLNATAILFINYFKSQVI